MWPEAPRAGNSQRCCGGGLACLRLSPPCRSPGGARARQRRFAGAGGDRHQPLPPALAAHRDQRLVLAQRRGGQGDQLGRPQARAVEQFQRRHGERAAVAGQARGAGDQRLHLGFGERLGQAGRQAGAVEQRAWGRPPAALRAPRKRKNCRSADSRRAAVRGARPGSDEGAQVVAQGRRARRRRGPPPRRGGRRRRSRAGRRGRRRACWAPRRARRRASPGRIRGGGRRRWRTRRTAPAAGATRSGTGRSAPAAPPCEGVTSGGKAPSQSSPARTSPSRTAAAQHDGTA